MNKTIIIQGSSRSHGNTNTVVQFIMNNSNTDFIDLSTKTIGHYDYLQTDHRDDFMPIMKNIIANYDTIVFATPVYWYSMSGVLKVFLDRFIELMYKEKTWGQQLRGKKMALISCGSGPELKDGFTMPFVESAQYLGMEYLGDIHTWIENDQIPESIKQELGSFIDSIN